MPVEEGRQRVIIEAVEPQIDGGRFAIKRSVGESVVVTADLFADGHDMLAAVLMSRKEDDERWTEVRMEPLVNDRWKASFPVSDIGVYFYTIEGWIDNFHTWQRDLKKKVDAGQDVAVDLQVGAALVDEAAGLAGRDDARLLKAWAERLRNPGHLQHTLSLALGEELSGWMEKYSVRHFPSRYGAELRVVVDRERARFSSWYELFPRSTSPDPGRHGTFADCEARLPYVASMGFDVIYLPPIHPIGRSFRKGKNNAPKAGPQDTGSPWAIGSAEGGHRAIHPELGSREDFRRLVEKARSYGLETALDIAYQCAPDHPYVSEHPEWFRTRPDGTVQYAENPPKKYQDIYPLFFENESWRELWDELTGVVLYWIDQGVKIFRVDNPHTKPFHFWEYLIGRVREKHPETIFLSEAFTRPKVMYYLAKLGFTQSYTYFAWRNTKAELTEYLTELTQTPLREFFRPNFWPNTPDILTEYLQFGGPPAFKARLVLAATLAASYGIYGPAFEQCVHQAREPGSEEYLDSEKYQIRHWDLNKPGTLRDLIRRVNQARRENAALQSNDSLRFHSIDNDQIICYSKQSPDKSNLVLVVVNLDTRYTQSGWVDLPLEELGLDLHHPYQMHDLLSDSRFIWSGPSNYVELNPDVMPAHVFRVRRHVRTEHNFEYYL